VPREGYVVIKPNQQKASSKLARLIVTLLLLASVALLVIVSLGAWSELYGAKPVQVFFILVYLIAAFFIMRWKRGLLPMIAGLAIILGIFAAIAGPEWFSRNKSDFVHPGLGEDLVGTLVLLIVPVQILLILACIHAFRQQWNIEEEVPEEEARRRGLGGGGRRADESDDADGADDDRGRAGARAATA
jgi:hypothetical protein